MSETSGGLLCPACRVDLVMSERSGVEIDYCPKCRGVWLDRGVVLTSHTSVTTPTNIPPMGMDIIASGARFSMISSTEPQRRYFAVCATAQSAIAPSTSRRTFRSASFA